MRTKPIIGSEMSPLMVADWFRKRSEEFAKIANMVEKTFKSNPLPFENLAGINGNETSNPILERAKELMRHKKMRVGDLSMLLNISKSELISSILTSENGFEIGPKGWIKYVK